MRNLFLALILANLLFLAWQVWIDPSRPAPPLPGAEELALYGVAAEGAGARESGRFVGGCLRIGPLPSNAAARQARDRLAARGIDAEPVERETQQWLGHWISIGGFASVPAAEEARQRLIDSGLADAYLMQDGPEPAISLGVFRDRTRADRVAGTARNLGFDVVISDRNRPVAEQWLLIRPRAGQSLGNAQLGIAEDRIIRTESAPCGPEPAAGSP